MKGSRNLFISLLVVGAFAAAGFFLLARNAKLPEHPLDRVPASAEMVAWVDVPAVLRSTLWQRFVVASGEDAALRRLTERCGFDPLGQVANVDVFVTGEPGSLEHIGFVAEGDFDHEALAGCLRSAVTEDGGSLQEVEIEGMRAVASAHGPSRAAFVGARGIVAGHEDTVASTVRAIVGREATLGADTDVRALWDRLARTREIVAVAKIPEHWQDGLRRLLGSARADVLIPHLEHLRTLGLGARVSRGLGLTFVAVMASDEAATDLATKAREALQRLTSNPIVAISPAGAVLNHLETNAEGKDVTVALDVTQERLDRILGFADRMIERIGGVAGAAAGGTPSPSPSAAAAPAPAPAPDAPAPAAPTPAR